jgi:hypothetical protein
VGRKSDSEIASKSLNLRKKLDFYQKKDAALAAIGAA